MHADLLRADRDVIRVRAPDANDDGSIGVDQGREIVQSVSDQVVEQLRHFGLYIADAHWSYRTRKGKPRWVLVRSVAHQSDLLIIVRQDEKAVDILDYLLVPDVTSDVAQQALLDRNHLEIDSFRASSLEPLRALFARQELNKSRLLRRLERVPKSAGRVPCLPRFSRRRLARKGRTPMGTFIEKCRRIGSRQRALESALQRLFCDPLFFRMLSDEGLDTLPSLTAGRIFE